MNEETLVIRIYCTHHGRNEKEKQEQPQKIYDGVHKNSRANKNFQFTVRQNIKYHIIFHIATQ